MAPEREQVKPLAPIAYRIRGEEDEALAMQLRLRRRRYIKCCGCFTALFLILAVIILVLAFTVFQIKNPVIRMNSVTLQRDIELVNGNLRRDVNITAIADVSVKNPNAASFRYSNSTTIVYYVGEMVGEGTTPSGNAKARHTQRMNMTMNIIPDKILAVPNLTNDWTSEALAMSTYTKLNGRVNILKITKKNVEVQMNCTFTYNVSGQPNIQDQKCHSRVRL